MLALLNLQNGFEKLCPLFNKTPFSLDILIVNAICCHFHKMIHEIVEMKNMLRVKLCHAIHSIENGRTFNIEDKLMETYALMQQLSASKQIKI
jgi:hypothetical protein